MPRPQRHLPRRAAVVATALFAVGGLAACGGPVADDVVDPVVLTEADGTLRGPEEGARPVSPPAPAQAGDPTQASSADTRPEPGDDDTTPAPSSPAPSARPPADGGDDDRVETDEDGADDPDEPDEPDHEEEEEPEDEDDREPEDQDDREPEAARSEDEPTEDDRSDRDDGDDGEDDRESDEDD